jgi:sugar lactone lactonase YvrE
MKGAGMTVVAALFSAVTCAQVLGTKPRYELANVGPLPNEQAIARRIWVPGLDEGYVPQGLAVAGRHVLVSAYRSADPKVNTGPCRVFRIEAATGKDAGFFDMPSECGHAGGMAYLGKGTLVVADTRQLWRIDLEKALASGKAEGALKGTVKIAGELRGSFTVFDGTHLWIGTWTKEAPKAKLYRLDPRLFDDYDGQTVKEDRALEAVTIPVEAQGAAFDKDGNLWISTSNSREGALYRLDRKSGAVLARHEMMIGIEDLEFDAAGRLWAVSEAGARKYVHWSRHHPLIFEIDVTKLK